MTSNSFFSRFPSVFLVHRNHPSNNASSCVIISNKTNDTLSKSELKKQKATNSNLSLVSASNNSSNKALLLSKQNSSNAIVSLRVFYF